MRFADVPEIVYFDTEFTERAGEIPELICVVGYNTKSQRWFEYWADEVPPQAPFSKNAVLIGYAMSSDLTCIESRGWCAEHFIDLHAEYKRYTNEIGKKVNTTLLSVRSLSDHAYQYRRKRPRTPNLHPRWTILSCGEADYTALLQK